MKQLNMFKKFKLSTRKFQELKATKERVPMLASFASDNHWKPDGISYPGSRLKHAYNHSAGDIFRIFRMIMERTHKLQTHTVYM